MRANLERLSARYKDDPAFAALRARTPYVPGDGSEYMPLVAFVGEAPGEREERTIVPFVGPAGQLLRGMMDEVGMDDRNCYVTNVVKYRPPSNRPPTPEEVSAARPYIRRELAIVSPEVVVPLGRHALQTLLPNERRGITALHGKPVMAPEGRTLYFPMLHPSYILRNKSAEMMSEYLSAFGELRRILG